MNKKAQVIQGLGFSIVVGIMLFFCGMIIMNFIKDDVTIARNSDNLNCSDSTISDGTKLTCLLIDAVVPYFIIIVVSAAGGYITQKFVVG